VNAAPPNVELTSGISTVNGTIVSAKDDEGESRRAAVAAARHRLLTLLCAAKAALRTIAGAVSRPILIIFELSDYSKPQLTCKKLTFKKHSRSDFADWRISRSADVLHGSLLRMKLA
jgi:hypothetical protein